jgi:hypothetical protein
MEGLEEPRTAVRPTELPDQIIKPDHRKGPPHPGLVEGKRQTQGPSSKQQAPGKVQNQGQVESDIGPAVKSRGRTRSRPRKIHDPTAPKLIITKMQHKQAKSPVKPVQPAQPAQPPQLADPVQPAVVRVEESITVQPISIKENLQATPMEEDYDWQPDLNVEAIEDYSDFD